MDKSELSRITAFIIEILKTNHGNITIFHATVAYITDALDRPKPTNYAILWGRAQYASAPMQVVTEPTVATFSCKQICVNIQQIWAINFDCSLLFSARYRGCRKTSAIYS